MAFTQFASMDFGSATYIAAIKALCDTLKAEFPRIEFPCGSETISVHFEGEIFVVNIVGITRREYETFGSFCKIHAV